MASKNSLKLEKLVTEIIKKQPKLVDYNLTRLKVILSRLGSPQFGLQNIIHVAGTNGKGSTIATLKTLLRGHGYSVNSFTSPHLIKPNERININDVDISDEKLREFLLNIIEVKDKVPLSYFEILTCLCFIAFKKNSSDFNLIEVGLGGKKDATNVIDQPIACLITPISLDHKEFLGDELTTIASEKAGIIKQNVPVFLGKQKECVADIIKERAASLGCPLYEHGKDWRIKKLSRSYFCEIQDNQISLESRSLQGNYQLENSALALGTMYYLKLLNTTVAQKSLKKVVWPGRFQYLKKGPLYDLSKVGNIKNEIIIDGAHNPGGAEALSEEIKKTGWKNVYLILAMQRNKDLKGFVNKFTGLIKKIYFIDAAYDNFYTYSEANTALSILGLKIEPSVSANSAITALNHENLASSAVILITGSLHLVGDILERNS